METRKLSLETLEDRLTPSHFSQAGGTLFYTQPAFDVRSVVEEKIGTTVFTYDNGEAETWSGVSSVVNQTAGGTFFEMYDFGQVTGTDSWSTDAGNRSDVQFTAFGGVGATGALSYTLTSTWGTRSSFYENGAVLAGGSLVYSDTLTGSGPLASSQQFNFIGSLNGHLGMTYQDTSAAVTGSSFSDNTFLQGGAGSLTSRVLGSTAGGDTLSGYVRGNLGTVSQDNAAQFGPGASVTFVGPWAVSPY